MEAAAEAQPFVCLSFSDLIGFVFFYPLLNWLARLRKLFHNSSRLTLQRPSTRGAAPPAPNIIAPMEAEEIEMVLRGLGLTGDGQEGLTIGSGDFCSTFEEQEPSLDEVKGAFKVFDRNDDGFVDAKELGAVLRMMGLPEKASETTCQWMIDAFDDNGDGRIDFHEFVKLVEKSLC